MRVGIYGLVVFERVYGGNLVENVRVVYESVEIVYGLYVNYVVGYRNYGSVVGLIDFNFDVRVRRNRFEAFYYAR